MSDNIVKINNFSTLDVMYYYRCIIYFVTVMVLNGILSYHWPGQCSAIIGLLLVGYFMQKFQYNAVVDNSSDEVWINRTRQQIEYEGRIIPFRAIKKITVFRRREGNVVWTYMMAEYIGLNWSVKSTINIYLKDGTIVDIYLGNLVASEQFIRTMRRIVPLEVL